MKEGKKKTTARRNTSSSSGSKKVVPKNQTPKMPAQRSEPPKVKRIDVDEINKDFSDVESEDRRLIVFIAIAILVIVGTVIGLLVGCEKKENETPEPDKPGKTDVVVPEKPDEKGNKEDEDEGVKTKEIVRKVRAVYKPTNTKKSKNSDDDKEKEETVTYDVTFYLGEETKVETVESGSAPSAYIPGGYSTCKYYTNSDLTEESEYDISTKITESVNIYLSCEIITYTVNYGDGVATSNPPTYEVTDGTIELAAPETELFFNGWYTQENGGGTKVTALDKNIIEYADDDNVIRLYAYITEEEIIVPGNDEVITDEPSDGTEGNSDKLDFETIEGEEEIESTLDGEEAEITLEKEEILDNEETEITVGTEETEATEETIETDATVESEKTESEVQEEKTIQTEQQIPLIEETIQEEKEEEVLTEENNIVTEQLKEEDKVVEEEPKEEKVDESTTKQEEKVVEETKKEEEKPVQEEPKEEKVVEEELKEEEKVAPEIKKEESKKEQKTEAPFKEEKTVKVETPKETVKEEEPVKEEVEEVTE